MSARLYGRDVGNGSLAVVTRGFREALEAAGLLEGLVALDRSGGSEEDEPPPGALAESGIFTGNLNLMPVMSRGARHQHHFVQFTPNSTFVPRELLAAALKLPSPTILSCSAWGSQVLHENITALGFGEGPPGYVHKDGTLARVLTARHGISGFAPVAEEIELSRQDFEREQFRVAHFSTTAGERKGTLELIKAWQSALPILPPRAQLYLVLDHPARSALLQRLMYDGISVPERVTFVPRAELDSEKMSKLLCHMHLVACPSRGEGFGLLPLQARACGVPMIATVTTGHSAGHVTGAGLVPIEQPSWLGPIDDGPAALAPPLHPAQVVEALTGAYARWRQLSLGAQLEAEGVIEEWSWKKQLQPLVAELR